MRIVIESDQEIESCNIVFKTNKSEVQEGLKKAYSREFGPIIKPKSDISVTVEKPSIPETENREVNVDNSFASLKV